MHLLRLNDTAENLCSFDETIFAGDLRLLLVGILGSAVSIASIFENLLLFYVFSTSRKLRRQNYVNPVLLASFDILVSAIYLLISPVHFLAHRLQLAGLASFWVRNMRLLYCLEHFALTVCNLLLVVASIERYLANGPSHSQKCVLVFIVRNKPYVIVCILAFAFVLKATLFFEIELVELRDCEQFTEGLVPVWLAENATLFQAIRFWTRNFLTVILPFFILAYCNLKIVQQLRIRRRMTMIGEYSGSLTSQINANPNCPQSRMVAGEEVRQVKQQCEVVIGHECSPERRWRPSVRLMPKGSTYLAKQKMLTTPRGQLDRTDKKGTSAENACPRVRGRRKQLDGQPPAGSRSPPPYSSTLTPAGGPPSVSSPNNSFGVRVATRTLVMVVGCYLISNSMSTVLNIWEHFDAKFLRHDNFNAYLIASDIAALLTICGCALRFPIYVSNDKRIRKAICRALIRFRFCCSKGKPEAIAQGEEGEHFLEKYSIVIVSNSLRSNLTGALSQFDWATFHGKRSFDQLAILVQNRRKFLVQMTINLGAVHEMDERDSKGQSVREGICQRRGECGCSSAEPTVSSPSPLQDPIPDRRDTTSLTGIPEECAGQLPGERDVVGGS